MPHMLIKYARVICIRAGQGSRHFSAFILRSPSLASLWKFPSAAGDVWYWEVANKHGYCDDQEEHSQKPLFVS